MAINDFFVWGEGGQKKTPEQIARERKIADALIAQGVDTSPVGHWTQGAARMANALVGNIKQGRADASEKAGIDGATSKFNSLDLAKILSGGQTAYPSAVAAGASPTSGIATGTSPVTAASNFNIGENQDVIRQGIIDTANAIGADPADLATAISYETGGTFNPVKAGPTTQWGQHRGLIQFGEPQAKQHGVNWDDPIGSQLGANGAIANYFRSSGFKPGMSGLDLYSTINAGSPGRYSASDAQNGGAPGSVADKWNNQMGGHRSKALALLGSGGASTPQEAIEAISPTSGTPLFSTGADVSPADIAFAQQATGAPVEQQASPYPESGQVAPYDFTDNQQLSAGAGIPMQGLSPDQFNSRFGGAPESQTAQPDIMPTGSIQPQAAAQNPTDQISAALLAQNDKALGGALAPQGQAPQQAPSAQGYFPDAPAMGSYASTVPQPQQMQQGGNQLQALMAAASDPFLNDSQRSMINMALQQHMQNADPMRQMQMQKLQRELNTAPERKTMNINGNLVDAGTGRVIANFPDQTKPTSDIQNFEYARDKTGFKGTFAEYQQMVKKAGASSTNVSVGEGDKFYEALDKKNAETFSSLSDTGIQARSKIAQIDRLRGLMGASPSGASAALKLAAGEYGIKTEGLDDLQASQALINELVPQQRQPGSGPMSDADLALFKQSLPRIINTPDGNNLILDTMTGITQYQIQMGDIADQIANREITAAQGRDKIKNLANPLEGFRKSSKDIGEAGKRTSSGVQWSIEK